MRRFAILLLLLGSACGDDDASGFDSAPEAPDALASADGSPSPDAAPSVTPMPDDTAILYLHHSTGGVIWSGGVADGLATYASEHGKSYTIEEQSFPNTAEGYPWANYPYDYWNLWINHQGSTGYLGEPTLETLTPNYGVIVFKHCYPVSGIGPDSGAPDLTSETKSIENYQLQYEALKDKLRSFPNNRFIVWTGAALVEGATNEAQGTRARQFFTWVKDEWDEPGDNIFVWDFFELETQGGLYLLPSYSAGDSHPNDTLATLAAPRFVNRLVSVLNGTGDSTSLTGE